eukprot:420867_1
MSQKQNEQQLPPFPKFTTFSSNDAWNDKTINIEEKDMEKALKTLERKLSNFPEDQQITTPSSHSQLIQTSSINEWKEEEIEVSEILMQKQMTHLCDKLTGGENSESVVNELKSIQTHMKQFELELQTLKQSLNGLTIEYNKYRNKQNAFLLRLENVLNKGDTKELHKLQTNIKKHENEKK